MADREKVINEIEEEIRLGEHWDETYRMVSLQLLNDILALLKEQEAKTGHWISANDGDFVAIDNDGFPERSCFCSECKKYLIASDEYAVYGRYCPFCGAKMEGGR